MECKFWCQLEMAADEGTLQEVIGMSEEADSQNQQEAH